MDQFAAAFRRIQIVPRKDSKYPDNFAARVLANAATSARLQQARVETTRPGRLLPIFLAILSEFGLSRSQPSKKVNSP